MKRMVVCCAAALVLSACASSSGPRAGSPQEIAAATEAWRAAFNSRETVRVTSMYAPDAAFWGTQMKAVATTPAGVQQYFSGMSKFPDDRVVFNDQHIRVYGDTALNSGAYTFNLVREGKPIVVPARYSMAFRRQADGQWKIVDHHSSAMPQ